MHAPRLLHSALFRIWPNANNDARIAKHETRLGCKGTMQAYCNAVKGNAMAFLYLA